MMLEEEFIIKIESSYYDEKIENLKLSERVINALHSNHIDSLKDLDGLTKDDLLKLSSLYSSDVSEILGALQGFINCSNSTELTKENYLDAPVSILSLSNRCNNVFKNNKIKTVGDLIALRDQDKLMNLKNLGAKSAKETAVALSNLEESLDTSGKYQYSPSIKVLNLNNRATHFLSLNNIRTVAELDKIVTNGTIYSFKGIGAGTIKLIIEELLQFKEKYEAVNDPDNVSDQSIKSYFQQNDIPVELLVLSERSTNCLMRAGYSLFSQIVNLTFTEIIAIKSLGTKCAREIQKKIDETISKNLANIAIFLGDSEKLPVDAIMKRIVDVLTKGGFAGLDINYFVNDFQNTLSAEKINEALIELVNKNVIYKKDGLYYYIFPKFESFLQNPDVAEYLQPKEIEVLSKKYNGATLEEIGGEYGVTRERIRQILFKVCKKARRCLLELYGVQYFEEDYFTYLFLNYDIDKDIYNNYLTTDVRVINYLRMFYDHGKKGIDDATKDEKVDLSIRHNLRKNLPEYFYFLLHF